MKIKNIILRLDAKLWKRAYNEKVAGDFDNWESYFEHLFFNRKKNRRTVPFRTDTRT